MKEIVEKLCRIEAELNRRRAEDKLAAYNTGERKHEKQLAFHRCKKRNRWVFGGNRSGKTECGAAECVYMALGIHPYRENSRDAVAQTVKWMQTFEKITEKIDPLQMQEILDRNDAVASNELLRRLMFGGLE